MDWKMTILLIIAIAGTISYMIYTTLALYVIRKRVDLMVEIEYEKSKFELEIAKNVSSFVKNMIKESEINNTLNEMVSNNDKEVIN